METKPVQTDSVPAALNRTAVLLAVIGFEGALIVVALLIGALVNTNPLTLITWSVRDVVFGLSVAIAILAMVVTAIEHDIAIIRNVTKNIDEVVGRLFVRSTLTDLAIISVFAGVGEELLFRGVIQHALTPVTGSIFALIVGSLTFGIAHLISASYFWYATAFGFAAGGLFLVTGSLIAPIIAHAVYDFGALSYLVRRHRGAKQYDENEPIE